MLTAALPAIWHGVLNNGMKPGSALWERCREIHQACRLRKSHSLRSTMIRHYVSCIITLQVQQIPQAVIRLKEVRDERQKLVLTEVVSHPILPSVVIQAAQGDRAVSQLRGWIIAIAVKISHAQRQQTAVSWHMNQAERRYTVIPVIEARLQKNRVFVSVTKSGQEDLSVRIMVGLFFRNHHDRNALADKLDLIAPVLFGRDPRMGLNQRNVEATVFAGNGCTA